MDELQNKYEQLKKGLLALGSVAVAFSAGVDSAFLLKAAHDTLGDNAIAITAEHSALTLRERDDAVRFCREQNVRRIGFEFDCLSVEGFSENPPDRCYVCKKAIFGKIAEIARANGVAAAADGTNADDAGERRPGMRALAELGIVSPLRDAGLTKADIRALSKKLGLATWDRPSGACLATRVPYGEKITAKKLAMIGDAEEALLNLGFRGTRVRCHGDVARIEVENADFDRMLDPAIRSAVSEKLKEIGFLYVSLDLEGYKTGSLDRALDKEKTG